MNILETRKRGQNRFIQDCLKGDMDQVRANIDKVDSDSRVSVMGIFRLKIVGSLQVMLLYAMIEKDRLDVAELLLEKWSRLKDFNFLLVTGGEKILTTQWNPLTVSISEEMLKLFLRCGMENKIFLHYLQLATRLSEEFICELMEGFSIGELSKCRFIYDLPSSPHFAQTPSPMVQSLTSPLFAPSPPAIPRSLDLFERSLELFRDPAMSLNLKLAVRNAACHGDVDQLSRIFSIYIDRAKAWSEGSFDHPERNVIKRWGYLEGFFLCHHDKWISWDSGPHDHGNFFIRELFNACFFSKEKLEYLFGLNVDWYRHFIHFIRSIRTYRSSLEILFTLSKYKDSLPKLLKICQAAFKERNGDVFFCLLQISVDEPTKESTTEPKTRLERSEVVRGSEQRASQGRASPSTARSEVVRGSEQRASQIKVVIESAESRINRERYGRIWADIIDKLVIGVRSRLPEALVDFLFSHGFTAKNFGVESVVSSRCTTILPRLKDSDWSKLNSSGENLLSTFVRDASPLPDFHLTLLTREQRRSVMNSIIERDRIMLSFLLKQGLDVNALGSTGIHVFASESVRFDHIKLIQEDLDVDLFARHYLQVEVENSDPSIMKFLGNLGYFRPNEGDMSWAVSFKRTEGLSLSGARR